MDNNNSNKKQKLHQRLAESKKEFCINNSTRTFGNNATVNGDVNQSNTSTVNVPNSGGNHVHTQNGLFVLTNMDFIS